MMIMICLACTALTVLWALPGPRRQRLEQLAGTDIAAGSSAARSARRIVLTVLAVASAAAIVLAVGYVVGGGRGLTLSTCLVIIALTAGRLAGQVRQRGRAGRRAKAVARACAALAAQLRVGQIPAEALATAAVDHPVLAPGQRCLAVGGDVVGFWRQEARRPGAAGLLELARAWQVAAITGAPMAATLEQVAAAQAAERTLRSMIDGELAAPRATSKIMAVLPLCGIGLGYTLGGRPVDWLLAGPLGWACLSVGVGLACAGVLWIAALAERVAG